MSLVVIVAVVVVVVTVDIPKVSEEGPHAPAAAQPRGGRFSPFLLVSVIFRAFPLKFPPLTDRSTYCAQRYIACWLIAMSPSACLPPPPLFVLA